MHSYIFFSIEYMLSNSWGQITFLNNRLCYLQERNNYIYIIIFKKYI